MTSDDVLYNNIPNPTKVKDTYDFLCYLYNILLNQTRVEDTYDFLNYFKSNQVRGHRWLHMIFYREIANPSTLEDKYGFV